MKLFAIFSASLLASTALISNASAADLAARPYTKAPPMMQAAAYDWSGFYIGINGGWAETHDRRTFDPVANVLGDYNMDGGTVGGQIGYRWQSGGWVFGLEAQGNWADLSGSTTNTFLGAGNFVRSKMDAFGLFTGQIGYAWNNVLLYVKGGAAVTDRNYTFETPGLFSASTGYDTRWSPTVGAGLEYGFAPNWSFGVEYDHIFEDRHGATFSDGTGFIVPGPFSTGGDTDMVLGRLNYKFGYGAPLMAKY